MLLLEEERGQVIVIIMTCFSTFNKISEIQPVTRIESSGLQFYVVK